MTTALKNKTQIGEPTNGGAATIEISEPYIFFVEIQGTADLLFHRWNCDAIQEKSNSKKGSKAKKTDDLESYVYRCDNGNLGLPGEYLRQSIILAAKYRQDPRSPRKSAMDLYKAGVISLTNLSDFGVKDWDYEDRRRVTIQRAGITRIRPAMKAGWRARYEILVQTPEYINQEDLVEVITNAGRLIGVGDFRPTFGRFIIVRWNLQ